MHDDGARDAAAAGGRHRDHVVHVRDVPVHDERAGSEHRAAVVPHGEPSLPERDEDLPLPVQVLSEDVPADVELREHRRLLVPEREVRGVELLHVVMGAERR